VILRGDAWEAERTALYLEAKGLCEGLVCPGHQPGHPLLDGDPHHIYGKGAGKRTDTIFSTLPDGARRRNLLWTCRTFHDYIHSIGIRKWREENVEYLNSLSK